MRQRYDEFADWYDTYVTSGAGQPVARSADRLLERLLGPATACAAANQPPSKHTAKIRPRLTTVMQVVALEAREITSDCRPYRPYRP
jgi:hypothetical protein